MGSKQSRFNLVLLGIVAVGVLVLVVGLFVLQQLYSNTRRLQAEKDKYDKELKQVIAELATRAQSETKLADLTKELATLDNDLAAYEYMPTYLKQLQKKAIATGNHIRSILPREVRALDLKKSPLGDDNTKKADGVNGTPPTATPASTVEKADETKGTTKKPRYLVQQIGLEIEGSYPSMLSFLNELRKFPKMVYVRGVSVSPQTRDNEYVLRTRLETYAIIIPSQYVGGPEPKKGR